jgi:hypothetical protein
MQRHFVDIVTCENRVEKMEWGPNQAPQIKKIYVLRDNREYKETSAEDIFLFKTFLFGFIYPY